MDDDEIDREAIARGFREQRRAAAITVARNGAEALGVLRGAADKPPLARPYIVLLDLNMPGMDGFAFLDALRADPQLQAAVVFVFTTSTSEADKTAAYRKGISGYISKARLAEDCKDLIRMISRYWQVVEMPS